MPSNRPRDTPVVAGVYFLFKADALVYVGQSKDCYGRIETHRSHGREFDLATVMPLASEFIGRVEAGLIKAFQPAQNVAHKPAPPKPVFSEPFKMMPKRTAPTPDGLGLISQGKARLLASSFGLRSDTIAEAVATGALTFVATGQRCGRGGIRVALFETVEAYCRQKQQETLAALGFAKFSGLAVSAAGGA